MEQRITFVASIEVDDEGFNWDTAAAAVRQVVMEGSAPHYSFLVHRVTRLENLEEDD